MQATQKITARTFTIDGPSGKIFVDDGGKGNIPALFVHSFGGNTHHWSNQLEHLRKNRRAVAFDLRGHGESATPPNNDYTVSSLCDDIAAVTNELDLNRCVLVGHSMGGSAAISFAANYPEKVAGLVVCGTPGRSPAESAKQIIASLESDQYEAVMEKYMSKLLEKALPKTSEMERAGMKKIPKEASVEIIRSIFNYDPLPDFRKYKGPKLIVSIDNEEQAHSLHESFPDVPYQAVAGTSHWIQLDKPTEFNKILDAFLQEMDRNQL